MAGPKAADRGEVAEGRIKLLETLLREGLSAEGALGDSARSAGLRFEKLVKQARTEAAEILQPSEESWARLQEAQETRRSPLGRRPGESKGDHRFRLAMFSALVATSVTFVVLVVLPFVTSMSSYLANGFKPQMGLLLFAFATFAALVSSFSSSRDAPVLKELLMAAEKDNRRAVRACVNAWLRQQVGMARERIYSTRLEYGDCSGLGEVDNRELEISTETERRVLRLIKHMPGGAIGISGPRGVGKSTLLRAICRLDPKRPRDRPLLAVVVDAPVEYDVRDFALHLFAEVCSQIVGRQRVARLRGWDRSPEAHRIRGALSRLRPLLALALIVTGVLVAYGIPHPSPWFGLSRNTVGTLIALAGSLLIADLPGSILKRIATYLGLVEDPEIERDVNTALVRLRQIWFQQSFSSGWSGSLKGPAGLQAETKMATELSERQMTLPDIVDLFKGFLRQVSTSRDIHIGIDELDKMDDGDARRFLNEIKVVFRIPDCFFFISVSEDAMSAFERRGLPLRDVFDSSFDDVVRVPQLEFTVVQGLLEERITDLSLPFACLLHCMSGGLPRDLIRAARELVELKETREEEGLETNLNDAAEALVGKAVRSKIAAARIATRGSHAERRGIAFALWLEQLEAAVGAQALLTACLEFEAGFLASLGTLPVDVEEVGSERRAMRELAVQLAAYAYLASTVLEFIATLTVASEVHATIGDNGESGISRVDRLAQATQSFSVDAYTAWQRLSEIRGDLGWAVIPFPLPDRG